VRTEDLNVGSVVTVFPEGAEGDAASQTVLIRLPDGLGQSVDGYVAFSKVCTHAGCPVALYRAAQHQLMCPCHQSVFDVVNGGNVLAGPADHALPQLPIEIGADGYLHAKADFPVPIGPGFWERG
jgi:ubiquinol-cytochrome c reductase iron-sulfur subunit